jgi:hypothetical protein
MGECTMPGLMLCLSRRKSIERNIFTFLFCGILRCLYRLYCTICHRRRTVKVRGNSRATGHLIILCQLTDRRDETAERPLPFLSLLVLLFFVLDS